MSHAPEHDPVPCPVCGEPASSDDERVFAAIEGQLQKHGHGEKTLARVRPRRGDRHWACTRCVTAGRARRARPWRQLFTDRPVLAYVDTTQPCAGCAQRFVFPAVEQAWWYEERQFWITAHPRRCSPCRARLLERTRAAELLEALPATDIGLSVALERAELLARSGDPWGALVSARALATHVDRQDPAARRVFAQVVTAIREGLDAESPERHRAVAAELDAAPDGSPEVAMAAATHRDDANLQDERRRDALRVLGLATEAEARALLGGAEAPRPTRVVVRGPRPQ